MVMCVLLMLWGCYECCLSVWSRVRLLAAYMLSCRVWHLTSIVWRHVCVSGSVLEHGRVRTTLAWIITDGLVWVMEQRIVTVKITVRIRK